MWQCLISSRRTAQENKFGDQTWAKWAKIWPQNRFFAIFSSLVHYFTFKLHRTIAWNNIQVVVEIKLTKKNWDPKNGPKIRVYQTLKFSSLVFFGISWDCSLGQCLTSSRAEISKKKFVVQIRAEQTQIGASYFIKKGKILLS